MKNFKIIIAFVSSALCLSACNDDFLDRYPLDAVASDIYFQKPDDLKAYVNQYYSQTYFPKYANHGSDFDSDVQILGTVNARLEGTRVVATTGSIGFGAVRSINYFFDNYQRVAENHAFDSYKQYVGEAYFFKALIYHNLVKTYGDIQWYDTELGVNSEELYKPRDSRTYVTDRILACLDTAAMYLSADKTNGDARVNKWMALLIQSRVALYEGSWQKYHSGTPFATSNADPNKYFRKAAEAASQVMASGLYDVYTSGSPQTAYQMLFNRMDYTGNKEVLFWRRYDNELSRGNSAFVNDRNIRMETPTSKTMTKQMMDTYLASDGKPIAGNPLFQGYDNISMESQNRDPRFRQTIATPDQIWKILANGTTQNWSTVYNRLNSNADHMAPAGYVIQKGYNPDMQYHTQQYEETPSILYRYAEVLLNFAEAKAELGEISQADINSSINKLRARVGMPDLVMASITNDPNWDFPQLSPLINEIRRERVVELVGEGFRWDDIARWAAADELIVGQRPKGFKASQVGTNPFPVDENGFLDPFKNAIPTGYKFRLDRDYLNSIPESEIVLNPALTQNPGW